MPVWHAGYDWQFDPTFLVGIEGDIAVTGVGSKSSTTAFLFNNNGSAVPAGNAVTMSETTRWLSSVRGRIGFISANNYLFYATGGAAWAETAYDGGITSAGSVLSIRASSTTVLSGWVGGGGLEYFRPSQHWTVRAEYLNYSLPKYYSYSAMHPLHSGR